MKRRAGFTLIEVLAALGIIIVLTLTLVITINSQLQKAKQRNVEATVQTVNTQIEVEYNRPDMSANDFNSQASLVSGRVITAEQLKVMTDGKVRFVGGQPPHFEVTR
ncbi:prepilin-type N-terminal cleavage/methylation domain-containing protein [Lacticaseibacillus saniviri]|uniref:Prepilin-type N-terminal cleavage/methylation domain-containing protein n=1 Tax=Lacticaseibacillus saniviri JCM 17471 = DSM 24301 TaxID=1293598 RepID=A0A0R2MSK3_9LACO|nr:prepilin-type N-terminal cleavage/methylation domain-containing protein [Lacticaseibacillus saniviri]KRO16564.1 hypothetical protein IV56_GL001006 [Lacticaseibacillus saniviri JCM 17471 = DSM 24301]MCG4281022.1 prepilin-type N-terminal cleavage/methylation domain-containing protein [Lacticaseibacillus saniviri]